MIAHSVSVLFWSNPLIAKDQCKVRFSSSNIYDVKIIFNEVSEMIFCSIYFFKLNNSITKSIFVFIMPKFFGSFETNLATFRYLRVLTTMSAVSTCKDRKVFCLEGEKSS